MRKVFIDAGAHRGDSIEQFYNWFKLIDDPNEYMVFAFEPNPAFKEPLESLRKTRGVNVHYQAIWTKTTTLEFAIDPKDASLGSTVMKGKKSVWDNGQRIPVSAFDFSRFLGQFKDDHVVVKMDVEGAEFPVLEKMIKQGTIKIPKLLMVEFHPNKVVEYTSTYKEHLVKQIKALGVKLYEWH